jgi:hypothetical protein
MKRMPRASARARSRSIGPRLPRRSTIVVTPSFFNSARPDWEGCAPRKSTSLILAALWTPAIFTRSAGTVEIAAAIPGRAEAEVEAEPAICARTTECGLLQNAAAAKRGTSNPRQGWRISIECDALFYPQMTLIFAMRRGRRKVLSWKVTTTCRCVLNFSTTFCVFPLDSDFTSADTRTPDSGARGARRTESSVSLWSVRNHATGPGSYRKIKRDVLAPSQRRWSGALLLELRRIAAGGSALASRGFFRRLRFTGRPNRTARSFQSGSSQKPRGVK